MEGACFGGLFWGKAQAVSASKEVQEECSFADSKGVDYRRKNKENGRGREHCEKGLLSSPGRKAPAPDPEAASGEWELLRLDSSKKELPSPCPDKESDKDLGPQLRLPSAPIATGEYAIPDVGHFERAELLGLLTPLSFQAGF